MSTLARSEQQQLDITALLDSMEELAAIAVTAASKGDTVATMAAALAGKFKAGKSPGLSLRVELPSESPSARESTVLVCNRTHTVTIVELVMENRRQDGTGALRSGLTRDRAKDLVMQRLHYRRMGNATLSWAKTEPFDNGEGGLGYEVQFFIKDDLPSENRSTPPLIAVSGTTVTLTGTGILYYTTDGTAPIPGGAGVATYSAPFTATSGDTVRASAVASGQVLSDFQQKTVP